MTGGLSLTHALNLIVHLSQLNISHWNCKLQQNGLLYKEEKGCRRAIHRHLRDYWVPIKWWMVILHMQALHTKSMYLAHSKWGTARVYFNDDIHYHYETLSDVLSGHLLLEPFSLHLY